MENTPKTKPEKSQTIIENPRPSERPAMVVFWMLLGGSAGINIAQSRWRLLEFDVGMVIKTHLVGQHFHCKHLKKK